MRAPFLRRDEELQSIAEKQQTYFVVVANRAKGEKRGDFCRQLALGLRSAAKIARRTHIDDQHDREFALFRELLHERTAQPRRYVPINRADLDACMVLAVLLKVHHPSFDAADL